jgi:hypothetical protein
MPKQQKKKSKKKEEKDADMQDDAGDPKTVPTDDSAKEAAPSTSDGGADSMADMPPSPNTTLEDEEVSSPNTRSLPALQFKRTTISDITKYPMMFGAGVALSIPSKNGVLNGAGLPVGFKSVIDPKLDEEPDVIAFPDLAVSAVRLRPPEPASGRYTVMPSVLPDHPSLDPYVRGLGAITVTDVDAMVAQDTDPPNLFNGFLGRKVRFPAVIAPPTVHALRMSARLYDATYEDAQVVQDYEDGVFGNTDLRRTPKPRNETRDGKYIKFVVPRMAFNEMVGAVQMRALVVSPMLFFRKLPELQEVVTSLASITVSPGQGGNADGTRTNARSADIAATYSNGPAGAAFLGQIFTSMATKPNGRFVPDITGSSNASEAISAISTLLFIPPPLLADGGMMLMKQAVLATGGATVQKSVLRRIFSQQVPVPQARNNFVQLYPNVNRVRRIAGHLFDLASILLDPARWQVIQRPRNISYFWNAGMIVPAPLARILNGPLSQKMILSSSPEIVAFDRWLREPWAMIPDLINDGAKRANWAGMSMAPALHMGLAHLWGQLCLNLPTCIGMSPALTPDEEIHFSPANSLSAVLWGVAEGQANPAHPLPASKIILPKAPSFAEREEAIGATPVLADLLFAATMTPMSRPNIAAYFLARRDRWKEAIVKLVDHWIDGPRDFIEKVINASIELVCERFSTLANIQAFSQYLAGNANPNAAVRAFVQAHVGNNIFPAGGAFAQMYQLPAINPLPYGAANWINEYAMLNCNVQTSMVERLLYSMALPFRPRQASLFALNRQTDIRVLDRPPRAFNIDPLEVRKMGRSSLAYVACRRRANRRPTAIMPIVIEVRSLIAYNEVRPEEDTQVADQNVTATVDFGPYAVGTKIYLEKAVTELPLQLVDARLANAHAWAINTTGDEFFMTVVAPTGRPAPAAAANANHAHTMTVATPMNRGPNNPAQHIEWAFPNVQNAFSTNDFFARFVALEMTDVEYRVVQVAKLDS